jgi:hypothetical protein
MSEFLRFYVERGLSDIIPVDYNWPESQRG